MNISSGAGLKEGAIGAHYAASKAGLLALTAEAARETVRDGIAAGRQRIPPVIQGAMALVLYGEFW